MFDPMADLSDSSATSEDPMTPATDSGDAPAPAPAPASASAPSRGGGGDRNYAKEIHSITIRAQQRTFYIDLKESEHGKFFKLSEKSRGGRKTTIMFDVEDLPEFIKAFQEMEKQI